MAFEDLHTICKKNWMAKCNTIYFPGKEIYMLAWFLFKCHCISEYPEAHQCEPKNSPRGIVSAAPTPDCWAVKSQDAIQRKAESNFQRLLNLTAAIGNLNLQLTEAKAFGGSKPEVKFTYSHKDTKFSGKLPCTGQFFLLPGYVLGVSRCQPSGSFALSFRALLGRKCTRRKLLGSFSTNSVFIIVQSSCYWLMRKLSL